MSRFNLEYTGISGAAMELAGSASFQPCPKNSLDERSSHSPSDDGSCYLQYPDFQKQELDVEGDSNASLTSQTLNSDGTPKRPMNAFMIFARRRRPQVSAENQSMRTGEISKILSREWNSMEMAQKQFYLDQAKQLKETFNAKYPDYVYRRRPNNSRKRRRTEVGSNRSIDSTTSTDPGDDAAGSTDLGESPVDGEGYLTDHSDLHPQMSSDSSATYNPSHFVPSQSRQSSYEYPSDISYRQLASGEHQLQYPPERLSQDAVSGTTLRQPHVVENGTHINQYQPYIHSHSQSQPSNVYPSDHNSTHGGWDTRDPGGRVVTSSWRSSSQERPKSYPSSSDWPQESSATSPTPSIQSSHFPFPTLSAPFFPNQSHIPGNYPTTSSPTLVHHPPTTQYDAGQIQGDSMGGRHGPGYDQQTYSTSPSISASQSYPAGGRDSRLYQQQHSRPLGLTRGHPVQSISTFSQSQSMQSTPPLSSGGSPSAPPTGYWPRGKLDGQ